MIEMTKTEIEDREKYIEELESKYPGIISDIQDGLVRTIDKGTFTRVKYFQPWDPGK